MHLIYKYLPPNRSTYFSDGLLRFTQPDALNDPFECQPVLSKQLIRELISDVHNSSSGLVTFEKKVRRRDRRRNERMKEIKQKAYETTLGNIEKIERYFEELRNELFSEIGIFSLSRSWDNALMWAHYSSDHTGFCIGFNAEHNFFKNPPAIYGVDGCADVIYDKNRKLLSTEKNDKKGVDILLTKSEDWKYEQEVRMIKLIKSADKTISSQPHNIALFKVPHDAVHEICMGLRISRETEDLVRNFAKENNVPIFQVKMSKDTFNFERIKIEVS